jgi:nitrite reductase/ring-hydroxylating ferredoxin subunit
MGPDRDADMSGWYSATDAKEIPEGSMKGIEVGEAKILLVHGPSGIRAFENRCGHMSAPLSLGTFKSGVIKCALHSAVFDAETGAVRGQPQMRAPGAAQLPPEMMEAMAKMGEIMSQIRCEKLQPYPVAVENGQVMVYV